MSLMSQYKETQNKTQAREWDARSQKNTAYADENQAVSQPSYHQYKDTQNKNQLKYGSLNPEGGMQDHRNTA